MPLFGGGGGESPFEVVADVIGKVTDTNQVLLEPTGTDEVQFRIARGAATTVANIFEVRNQTLASLLAVIGPTGTFGYGTSTSIGLSRTDLMDRGFGVTNAGSNNGGYYLGGGVIQVLFSGSGDVCLKSGQFFGWSSNATTPNGAALDTSLFRAAAGTVGAGTGGSTLGNLRVALGAVATPSLQFSGTSLGIFSNQSGDGGIDIAVSGSDLIKFRGTAHLLPAAQLWAWSATGALGNTFDVAIGRSAAAVLAIYGASASLGGTLSLASDQQVKFSGTTDPDGAADTGISRGAAGVINLTNGGAGTGRIRVGDGVAAGPAFAFINETNTGFFLRSTNSISLAGAGTAYWEFSLPGSVPCWRYAAGVIMGWTATSPDAGLDTGLGRSAAGIVGLYSDQAKALGASLTLASDKFIQWSSTTDPDGAADTGLERAAANVLRVSLAGAIDGLLCATLVEASVAGSGAPNVLGPLESRTLITNEGATAEAYNTLPTAVAGYEFEFYCDDADGIRITAAAADTIQVDTVLSAAAGFIRSTAIGSAIRLKAINATEWVAVSIVGTWTVDV